MSTLLRELTDAEYWAVAHQTAGRTRVHRSTGADQ